MKNICPICRTNNTLKGNKFCSRKCFYESRKGGDGIPWLRKFDFKKGEKSWISGLHIQTNTGKTHFKKGQIGWSRGKKRPEISILFKGVRPEKAIESAKIANRGNKYRLGKRHTEETKIAISESRKGKAVGKNNPRWNNGVSELRDQVRHLPEYRLWRENIFKKDNYRCIFCGKGGYLEADHNPEPFAKLLQEAITIYGKDVQFIRSYTPLFQAKGRTVCKECHPHEYMGNQYQGGVYL